MNPVPWLKPALAAGAAILLAAIGFWAGLKWDAGAVQSAKREVAQIRADLAVANAEGEREAASRQIAALEALRTSSAAAEAAVAAIPAQVAARLSRDLEPLQRLHNAPDFDCLRRPLPDDARRVFDRPGGIAAPRG